MLFVEPEVDCFRLHLSTLRIPSAVLDQKPDAIATAASTKAAEVSSPPHLTRKTAEPTQSQPAARCAEGGHGERRSGSSAAVSPASPSQPFAPDRSSATVSASTRTSTTSADDLPPPLAHISLDERADALHRALLSALYSRFPYELPDTLEYVYVLVVTHHAAPSIAEQPLTAEELSCLTTHYDFLPVELRCRTFPSHLNAVLDPAWTTAAATVAAATTSAASTETTAPPQPQQEELPQQQQQQRPSIRVTGDTDEKPSAEGERRTVTGAATDVLHNIPMAPRFYDSLFLLTRELTPAQQALYYETQCRGRAVPATLRRPSPSAARRPVGTDGTATDAGGLAEDVAETFHVIQGDFTHFIPVNGQDASTSERNLPSAPSALATATQRISRGNCGGYRRVAGESETFTTQPRSTETTRAASAAGAAADVRALHFSVYRIPLTRFCVDDQQYYTEQREEVRWRQHRRCRTSYPARRRSRAPSSHAGATAAQSATQKGWWERFVGGSKAPCSGTSPRSTGADSIHSRSSSSNSCSTCSSLSNGETGDLSGDSKGQRRRQRQDFDDVFDDLFQQEASFTSSSSTRAAELFTSQEQRSATHFFETCHKVLTNYAVAHSTLEVEGVAASASTPSATSPQAEVNSCTSPIAMRQRSLSFSGVSFLGVTRLLYSFAPCDCYHLVMKDNNPLYYAQSSRASYQPQTVPLCLVSDLTNDSRSGASAGHGGRSPRATTAGAGQSRETVLRSTSGGARPRFTGVAGGTNEAHADPVGRASPGPDIAGKVLWLTQAAEATPRDSSTRVNDKDAEQQVDGLRRLPLPSLSPRGSHEQRNFHGNDGRAEDGLVRSRQPSRATSPDRAERSLRTSNTMQRPHSTRRTAATSSRTEGTLILTASLVSNSISGNPQRNEQSLSQRGAEVPDFLLPDAARQGPGGAGRAAPLASRVDAVKSSSSSPATAAAVVNLFRALAESSLAQHKLRYGSIRSVVSVAVLDSSRYLAGGAIGGMAGGGVDGAGARRCGTSEATEVQQSARYCCRGLVDHTWMSLPVQRTPAEQEVIQWMPVMLGSTECVSDVGLRTAVHLGIFPSSTPDNESMLNRESKEAACTKEGTWPTREGALSSLKPSSTIARTKGAGPSCSGGIVTDMRSAALKDLPPQPLQQRAENGVDATGQATKPPPSSPSPPLPQRTQHGQPVAKENQCASAPSAAAAAAVACSKLCAGTKVHDPDGYEVPTSALERKAACVSQSQRDDVTPSYRTASTTDAPPPPDTRPSSPRLTHVSTASSRSSAGVPGAFPDATKPQSEGPLKEMVEDVPVDFEDEEAIQAAPSSVRIARGGIAMTYDVDAAPMSASRGTPITASARTSIEPLRPRDRGTRNARFLPPMGEAGAAKVGGVPRTPFHQTSAGRDESGGDGLSTMTTAMHARKGIVWADKARLCVPAFASPTTVRSGPSSHRAVASTASTPSSWTALSSFPGRQEEGTRGSRSSIEIIERENEDDEAEELGLIYKDKIRQSVMDSRCRNEEQLDDRQARQWHPPPSAQHTPKPPHLNVTPQDDPLSARKLAREVPLPSSMSMAMASSAANVPNPFRDYLQSSSAASYTPPRSSRLPACFSGFSPAALGPQEREPETFFDDHLASSGSAAPSPHTPTPRRAVQLPPPPSAPPAEPRRVVAHSAVDETAFRRPPLPLQRPQQRFSATPARSTFFSNWQDVVADDSASPSVLNCSLSAISYSSRDASLSAGEPAAPQRGYVQPLCLSATSTPAFDAHHSVSVEGVRGRGGAEAQQVYDVPKSAASKAPSAYFDQGWNARRQLYAATDPSPYRPSSATTAAGTAAPQVCSSPCEQQPRQHSSFFASAFGRPVTLVGRATGNASPVTTTAPPQTPLRRTLGIGRLTAHSPPAPSVRLGPHTLDRAAAPHDPTQMLYIVEYDDAVVKERYGGRDTTVRTRVRPRGVAAMDPTWWQPVRELSSAPNLRFSSAYAPAAPPVAAAEGYARTAGAVPPRTSAINGRLSTSTDQPYNVSSFSGGEHSTYFRRDTYNVPAREDIPQSLQPNTTRPLSHLNKGFYPTESRGTVGRFSSYASHAYSTDTECARRTEHPLAQGFSPSPLHTYSHGQMTPAPRDTRGSTSATAATAILGRRPPLVPSLSRRSEFAPSHRYAAQLPPLRSYSAAASSADAERRRHELRRQRKLDFYQQHLQENYMCGTAPKRFCFERPPLHPSDVAAAAATSPRAAGEGIQVLRHGFGSSGQGTAKTQTSLAESLRWAVGAREANAASPPPPPPSSGTSPTTAVPSCSPSYEVASQSRETAGPAGRANHPLSEAARAYSLGVHPSSPSATADGGVPPEVSALLSGSGSAAEAAAQHAEVRLRDQAEQEECMRVRRQMEQLADGEAAARLSRGVNVSFTLRDIAAVLLRVPNTKKRWSCPPDSTSQVTGEDGSGLEVLDICAAARRTTGVSCFLSRKPNQLQGGWESYLERINLYQEPFYLRDQAFILLLPVPHVPELKVCVAIHNVNDVLALVCQTPVPRILPTAEETWMRERRYGWDGDALDVASPGVSVTVEERRWFFGLFSSRRIIQGERDRGGGAAGVSASASAHQSQRRPTTADDDAAMRRARCRALRRQYQLDGLCITWRHRLRIWYALFQSGRSCLDLPACTSPLLTDPVMCTARCALLCDRVAAYAAVRHRLETLRGIRQAYVERRAEELSRQRVLKLCDAPYLKPGLQLGQGENIVSASSGTCTSGLDDMQCFDATTVYPSLSAKSFRNARARPGGVAFTLNSGPSSTWAALHGERAYPPNTEVSSVNAGSAVHQYNTPDVRRGCGGVRDTTAAFPVRPLPHLDVPHRFGEPRHHAESFGIRAEIPEQPAPTAWPGHPSTTVFSEAPAALQEPAIAPGMTRAMRLRCLANRRVAHGEAPVESLRHATCLFPSTKSADAYTASASTVDRAANQAEPQPSPSLRANWNVTNTRNNAVSPSTAPGSAGQPMHPQLFASATSSVASYASGTSLAPNRPAPARQGDQQEGGTSGTAGAGSTSAARLALCAAAASTHTDVILHIDRDDTLARALSRLVDLRAAATAPPLTTVLSIVPRSAQPVRGAGAGVVEGVSATSPNSSDSTAAAAPLYAGFVPSPIEVQQRHSQPFNVSIGQVQQLIQWQWEHHQHSYTLLPVPFARGSVVPSVDFALFAGADSGLRGGGSGSVAASSPSYAVSPLAREVVLHLARWAWLLPDDNDSSRSNLCFFPSRSGRHQEQQQHWTLWTSVFDSSRKKTRGENGRSFRLPRWRILMVLVALALVAQHPAWSLCIVLGVAAAFFTWNGLSVGLTTPLPSHRSNDDDDGDVDASRQREWRPRLFLLCGPRIRLPRLWSFASRRRRRRQHRCRSRASGFSHRFFSPLEHNAPPLRERVSLLYSVSEATTHGILERRREHFNAQVVITKVLRCQTCAAALLSRVQLALYGYSTALSFHVALLCLSYVLLYLAYAVVVQRVGCCEVFNYKGSSSFQGSLLSSLTGATTALFRHWWAATSSFTEQHVAQAAAVDALRNMSEASWRDVFESIRFLLLQRMQAAVDADAAEDSMAGAAGEKGDGDVSLDQRDSFQAGGNGGAGARPSYFYQNGRYYAYDAEPPAWAKSPSLQRSQSTAPVVASGTQFSMPGVGITVAAESPASSASAQAVRSLSEWAARVIRGAGGNGEAAGKQSLRDSPPVFDSVAKVTGGEMSNEGLSGVSSHAPPTPFRKEADSRGVGTAPAYNVTQYQNLASACGSTEPSLLWFLVLAYVVTVCVPWSPFRCLWRRVWGVLTHDDALVRRPLLTV